MPDVAQAVHRIVLDIVQQKDSARTDVASSQHLTTDLGLKSLDIARLVALLELKFGVDPFARLVAITDVRTVGDVCAAYRQALAEEQRIADDEPLAASRARGQRRRQSGGTQNNSPSPHDSPE